ncbi:MAG: hypothetical protein ABSE62_02140 [Chthoniobacteraceae bacterium]
MKPFWIALSVLLLICALGAGALWWQASVQLAALAAQETQLKADNARLNQDMASAIDKVQTLEQESAQLRAARALSSGRLEPDTTAETTPDASTADTSTVPPSPDFSPAPEPAAEAEPQPNGGVFSRMFKDPEMRKMLAAQQVGMLRIYYGEFATEAHLTPDEAQKFYQLLEDRQTALMDSSEALMSGGKIDINAATAATNVSDDAIRDLLGSNRYGLYKEFESTLPDRIQVQQLGQQLDAIGVPLHGDQGDALIDIMSQERSTLPNLQSGDASTAQKVISMTPEDIASYSQQVDAMNQRVYKRAMTVLTPQQLGAFAAFQKNVASAQLAGIRTAQQILRGEQ